MRATRSAHSSVLTSLTAPVSSTASGEASCRTRTVGVGLPGMVGGSWEANITREWTRE